MTHDQFTAWRKKLEWTQATAARELGLSLASMTLYERGRRSDGDEVFIPRSIELACELLAIQNGKGPKPLIYYVPDETMRHLAERIAIASRDLRDREGLKVLTPRGPDGLMPAGFHDGEHIALSAISAMCGGAMVQVGHNMAPCSIFDRVERLRGATLQTKEGERHVEG